jgi:DNA-binding winged helix-turn-helix (wHTH) protein
VSPVRFRFGPFVLSPRQRTLWRDGREVPLIPRYFDLLVLLLRRRDEAVHRSDIFATVWPDVVVSDGALTQAVRALRRALGDDPREPAYIRTVSRHGYRFVAADVVEEEDAGATPAAWRASEGEPRGDAPPRRPAAGTSLPAGQPSPAPTTSANAGPRQGPEPLAASAEREVRGDPPHRGQGPRTTLTAVADGAVSRRAAAVPPDLDALVAQLRSAAVSEEERRDAAERLHALGTATALERLGAGPGAARAVAMLRDARWEVPGAGAVPLWGAPGGPGAVVALIALRGRRAWRLAGGRWLSSVAGAALAGVVTGIAGGLGLWLLPGAQAPPTAAAVLAVVGALAGAAGAAGIAAGLSATEAIARSARVGLLPVAGALGGLLAGAIAHWLTRWTLEGLFGLALGDFGGSIEGLLLGAAAGLGYAWATAEVEEGMAAPRGRRRWRAAAQVAACCAVAALGLGAAGRPMVGGLVNAIARVSQGSHFALTPLARAIGEPEFGPLTGGAVGAVEGAAFGCGLALGLTRRPRPRR